MSYEHHLPAAWHRINRNEDWRRCENAVPTVLRSLRAWRLRRCFFERTSSPETSDSGSGSILTPSLDDSLALFLVEPTTPLPSGVATDAKSRANSVSRHSVLTKATDLPRNL